MSYDLSTLNQRVWFESRRAVAMDLIFNELDDALLAGDIDGVRYWMRGTPEPWLSVAMLLGVLTITSPWRKLLLDERAAIMRRVRALKPDTADELLRGFE